MLDDIIDPHSDFQAIVSGKFKGGLRVIGNQVVNGKFVGATFNVNGALHLESISD